MEGDFYVAALALESLAISIHSLRMEGDATQLKEEKEQRKHFNPLPPHGGRQRERPIPCRTG